IELVRGEDVTIEVRDPLDRPVPGALVGFCVDSDLAYLRPSATDATGRATLPRVDPDLGAIWTAAPTLVATDALLDIGYFGPFGRGPFVVRCGPGVVVEGRVLD